MVITMDRKILQKLWSGSLIAVGVCSLVLTVPRLFDATLPDGIVRIVGVVSLLAVAVLMFTSVKKMKR